jgi:hypothetical protein
MLADLALCSKDSFYDSGTSKIYNKLYLRTGPLSERWALLCLYIGLFSIIAEAESALNIFFFLSSLKTVFKSLWALFYRVWPWKMSLKSSSKSFILLTKIPLIKFLSTYSSLSSTYDVNILFSLANIINLSTGLLLSINFRGSLPLSSVSEDEEPLSIKFSLCNLLLTFLNKLPLKL